MEHPGEILLNAEFLNDQVPNLKALALLVANLEPLLDIYSKAHLGEIVDWDISQLRVGSVGLGVYPDLKTSLLFTEPVRTMSDDLVQALAAVEYGEDPATVLVPGAEPHIDKWRRMIHTQNIQSIRLVSQGKDTTLTRDCFGRLGASQPVKEIVDSIRGTIQGVNFAGGKYFNLYPEDGGAAIRCFFEEELADQVTSCLRARVSVTGKIRTYRSGRSSSMFVTLPPRKLVSLGEIPRISELVGIAPGLQIARLLDDAEGVLEGA